MDDIFSAVTAWVDQERDFALAIVVEVDGSAPRPLGTMMAITADGDIAGNVSAGCVESAVVEQAVAVLDGSRPPGTSRYGISDDQAAGVGLTCGGTIGVAVFRPDASGRAALADVAAAVATGQAIAVAAVVDGAATRGGLLAVTPTDVSGSLGDEGLDAAVADDTRGLLASGDTGIRHYGPQGGRRRDEVAVLIQSHAAPARMLIFGAIDFAAALSRLGRFLGYRVTICDARAAFATPARFPDADEVVVAWPHRYLAEASIDSRTVMCVLTHDPKFDVPLLVAALRTPAAYIGVMGSRRSQQQRFDDLRAEGVDDSDLARLRAPIGLDLGARTPAETAVSIAAEIVALRWGGSGLPLRQTGGAIHAEAAAS